MPVDTSLLRFYTITKKQIQFRLKRLFGPDHPDAPFKRFDDAFKAKKLRIRKALLRSMKGFDFTLIKN